MDDSELFELKLENLDELSNMEMEGLELLMGYDAMPIEITIMMGCFALFFVVGVCGNLTVIVRIIRTHRQFRQLYGKDDSRRLTLQRYVMCLACVDLFVTIQIPILFPYLYSGQWLIGSVLCKCFWIIDNVNKILSIHILTAMAIERYFIVRNSVNSYRRRTMPRIATTIFFCGTALSILLLFPLISYVTLDISEYPGVVGTVTTCVSPMPDNILVAFIWYMFVLGYFVPALIVTFCYLGLVRMLKTRYRLTNMAENSKTQLVQKVSKSIMCVTAFHFICWTPFWVAHLLPILNSEFEKNWPDLMMRFQMFILLLPYVNCSFNWCFYVLLNHRLRKQIFRRSSSHYSTMK